MTVTSNGGGSPKSGCLKSPNGSLNSGKKATQRDDEHKLLYNGDKVIASELLDDGHVEIARIEPGVSFGETALVDEKPRMATIKCLTRCHFLILTKTYYLRALREIDKKKR